MPPDSAGPASTTSVAYWENRDSCLLILGHFFHAPGKCFSLQHLVHSAVRNVFSQFFLEKLDHASKPKFSTTSYLFFEEQKI